MVKWWIRQLATQKDNEGCKIVCKLLLQSEAWLREYNRWYKWAARTCCTYTATLLQLALRSRFCYGSAKSRCKMWTAH